LSLAGLVAVMERRPEALIVNPEPLYGQHAQELATAKAIGLAIPESFLLRANEVIE
jgi:hypothetical protein